MVPWDETWGGFGDLFKGTMSFLSSCPKSRLSPHSIWMRSRTLGCLVLVWLDLAFIFFFFFWHWRMFLSPLSSSIPYSCCSQKQNTPSSAHEFLTAHIWTHHMSVICSQFPDPCVLSYSSRNYCRICWVCKFHTASLSTCGMRNTNYFGKAERLS